MSSIQQYPNNIPNYPGPENVRNLQEITKKLAEGFNTNKKIQVIKTDDNTIQVNLTNKGLFYNITKGKDVDKKYTKDHMIEFFTKNKDGINYLDAESLNSIETVLTRLAGKKDKYKISTQQEQQIKAIQETIQTARSWNNTYSKKLNKIRDDLIQVNKDLKGGIINFELAREKIQQLESQCEQAGKEIDNLGLSEMEKSNLAKIQDDIRFCAIEARFYIIENELQPQKNVPEEGSKLLDPINELIVLKDRLNPDAHKSKQLLDQIDNLILEIKNNQKIIIGAQKNLDKQLAICKSQEQLVSGFKDKFKKTGLTGQDYTKIDNINGEINKQIELLEQQKKDVLLLKEKQLIPGDNVKIDNLVTKINKAIQDLKIQKTYIYILNTWTTWVDIPEQLRKIKDYIRNANLPPEEFTVYLKPLEACVEANIPGIIQNIRNQNTDLENSHIINEKGIMTLTIQKTWVTEFHSRGQTAMDPEVGFTMIINNGQEWLNHAIRAISQLETQIPPNAKEIIVDQLRTLNGLITARYLELCKVKVQLSDENVDDATNAATEMNQFLEKSLQLKTTISGETVSLQIDDRTKATCQIAINDVRRMMGVPLTGTISQPRELSNIQEINDLSGLADSLSSLKLVSNRARETENSLKNPNVKHDSLARNLTLDFDVQIGYLNKLREINKKANAKKDALLLMENLNETQKAQLESVIKKLEASKEGMKNELKNKLIEINELFELYSNTILGAANYDNESYMRLYRQVVEGLYQEKQLVQTILKDCEKDPELPELNKVLQEIDFLYHEIKEYLKIDDAAKELLEKSDKANVARKLCSVQGSVQPEGNNNPFTNVPGNIHTRIPGTDCVPILDDFITQHPSKTGLDQFWQHISSGEIPAHIVNLTQEEDVKGYQRQGVKEYTDTVPEDMTETVTIDRYTQWKDKSIPGKDQRDSLLALIEKNLDKRIVCHCIGGSGRSGAFLCMKAICQAIKDNKVNLAKESVPGEIDEDKLKEIVRRMILLGRVQRNPMFVQVPSQYREIIDVCKEYYNRHQKQQGQQQPSTISTENFLTIHENLGKLNIFAGIPENLSGQTTKYKQMREQVLFDPNASIEQLETAYIASDTLISRLNMLSKKVPKKP